MSSTASPSSAVQRGVTIDQVARQAGVSKAVVSALLSGKSYSASGGIRVSKATRQDVLRVARSLSYCPRDPAALVRLYPERGHYCLLINSAGLMGFDQYYVEILRGIVASLAGAQLNLNLEQFDSGVDYLAEPDRLPYAATNGWTTKFIFVGEPNYSLILALRERGYRSIYLSRQLDGKSVASAAPDYEMAGYLGADHLLRNGHRRIAMAAEHYFRNENLNYHVSRLERGVRRALIEHGIDPSTVPVVISREADQSKPSTLMRDLNALPHRPPAAFCFCDYSASRLIRAGALEGVRVPEDLSVVGCNDQTVARETTPPLTTIHFPLQELGRVAVQHFRRLDAGEAIPSPHYVLPVSLVERGSVRPLTARN